MKETTSFSLCSDLHLEHASISLKNEEGSDILLLAGDILPAKHLVRYARSRSKGVYVTPYKKKCYGKIAMDFMEEACAHYPHVVMISGNHEPYSGVVEYTAHRIREAFHHLGNFTLLDKEDVLIEGIRILGCTLWSKLNPLQQQDAMRLIKDYTHIRRKQTYLPIRGWHTDQWHAEERQWLKEKLGDVFRDGKPEETVVVMTHHAPCPLSIPEKYREHKMNAVYASDLSSLFYEFDVDYWVHGHIHSKSDYMIGNTRFLANPRGYPHEKIDFSPFKIEIENKKFLKKGFLK